ncbi:hypothetical protein BDN72DRAFT_846871 [Pluteus cervinus]|uniref:Uncharacterized protein n=1 Tax=Pluteus cervinus TaxID=181527 RepID=A0ACD3AET7_9AGAR|nr:hypothetical protein BDN72DRAFT_846871 [Pluteus cervinus]
MTPRRSPRSTNPEPAALQQPLASIANLPPPPTPTAPQAGAVQTPSQIDEPENTNALQSVGLTLKPVSP